MHCGPTFRQSGLSFLFFSWQQQPFGGMGAVPHGGAISLFAWVYRAVRSFGI